MAGIETRRRTLHPGHPQPSVKNAPLIATLFGLIPGLGAAYNGQHIKALVHFAIVVGLWQLADIFDPLEFLFGFSGLAFWLYSIYDARRAAQGLRAGEDLSREDEELKKLLREKTHVWGGLLVSVGVLSLLHHLFPESLYRFWPLLLIGAGLYLLRDFQRRRPASGPQGLPAQPPSVIAAPYRSASGEYESHYDQWHR